MTRISVAEEDAVAQDEDGVGALDDDELRLGQQLPEDVVKTMSKMEKRKTNFVFLPSISYFYSQRLIGLTSCCLILRI